MPTATDFSAFAALALSNPPHIGLVLGSGMSDALPDLLPSADIGFDRIPGLAAATVAGHHGRLRLAKWKEKPVLVVDGRLHFYEGHSWERVVKPVQIAHRLGVRSLLLTNAAGGIRDDLVPGSLMAVVDHIEWTRPYCWRHPAFADIGESEASRKRRRPERPYSESSFHRLGRAADNTGIGMCEGVYAAVTGPCYETPAEIRALRICGADAVGMSTAREATAASELGMEVGAVSLITNRAAGLGGAELSHDQVLATAAKHRETLTRLLGKFIEMSS